MGVYGNNCRNYKFSIVNEAYFGKSETLLEIEREISKLRQSFSYYVNAKSTDEVFNINRLFEKQFGMDIFSLSVIPSKIKNAYTYPVATRYDIAFGENLARKVEVDKNGYRFKKGNGLCIVCTLYSGLLTDPNITDAEIVAVILHEIGHNFADAISTEIQAYNKNMAMYRVYLMILEVISSSGILLPDAILNVYMNLNSTVANKEMDYTKHPILDWFTGIGAHISDTGYTINDFFRRLSGGIGIKLQKLLSWPYKVFKLGQDTIPKKNEVLADKFAGIHGYGPEQASVLIKMTFEPSEAQRALEKVPLLGSLCNASFENATKNLHEYDCHPHVMQRINSEITTLERELDKSDVDPKLKKVIKNQIDDLNKLKKEITTITSDKTRAERIAITYAAYIDNKMPAPLSKKFEKQLDSEIDKIVEYNK